MEIKKERQLESGDYQWDVECTTDEIIHFRQYALKNGQDIKNMTDEEIMQFSIVGMLKEEIEREENGQD